MERFIPAFFSFIVTLVITPLVMLAMGKIGKTGIDRHKLSKPTIPEMGGIALLPGIAVGYMILYNYNGYESIFPIFATLLIIWIIGIIDDIYAIKQRSKLIVLFFSGMPLVISSTGTIDLLVVTVDNGILFGAIVLVGIAASSNLTNILEGFNGEAIGLGVISTLFLSLNGYIIGDMALMLLPIPVCLSLLAFLLFNRYPAKVFPGDTGTLIIGGAVGAISIARGVEVLGVIVLLPQIVEFLLKSRVGFGGVSFGPTKVDEDGILHPPQYASVANLITSRIRLKEYQLVAVIWCIGAICGILSILFSSLYY